MSTMLKISSAKKGLIKLDSRTILFLLVIGNVAMFLMSSTGSELKLMAIVISLGILTGIYRFSIKMLTVYAVLFAIDYVCMTFFDGNFAQTFALGARYMRKVIPCAVLGGILILTIQVSEFMAALSKMHTPKSIMIPLTIFLRYLPAIGEDRSQIKKAMLMRNITPSFASFVKQPALWVECVYVPLLMSGSRRADELSAAAVTRGIENPEPRTSMHDVRFTIWDYIIIAGSILYIIWILRV